MAEISNGKIYRIRVHDIKQILNDIDDKLDKWRAVLALFHSPKAGASTFMVPVDKNVDEITVDVTGKKPSVTILDPRNEIYKNATEKLSLEQVRVVKVEKPLPGKWTIEARAESPNSVKLTAISNIVFEFGFSTSPPKSISETSFRPLAGDNHNRSVLSQF